MTFSCYKYEVIFIGLDPARPLIKPGGPNRLDSGDAKSVQVIHTNAGHYGEGGRIGHVDICMNGGRKQPYCGVTTSTILTRIAFKHTYYHYLNI